MPNRVTLRSRLPEIEAEIHPKVLAAAAVGAEAIAEAAKERVPTRTGRLKESIHVDKRGDQIAVVAGGTDAFYGHMIEFGTTHSPAHPFLIPATEERREAVIAAVRTALRTLA